MDIMKDSHLRSLVKATSWRIFGTFATMVIAFLLTHEITTSFYIGLSEFVAKIGLFYLHERVWSAIPFGTANSQANKLTKEILSPMSEERA
jgi:uncharacterized membrane protein